MSLTIAGFSSMTRSNRRTSCQTNMTQIYVAFRQYASDEGGGFPLYNANGPITTNRGIGLWALYTFPDDNDRDVPAPHDPVTVGGRLEEKPKDRYVRSYKVLHCPADIDNQELLDAGNPRRYNLSYLSYQGVDNRETPDDTADDVQTYDPVRTIDQGNTTARPESAEYIAWKRQLLHYTPPAGNPTLVRRQPTDNTIITWCRWHRPGGRKYDNVLFYDGTVQLLPVQQEDANGQSITQLWQRVQKRPE
jgi:hypothetical protein